MNDPASSSGAIIECLDVCKTYVNGKIEVPALHGVAMRVSCGETVGVSGTSGCGKTTLLNLIGGLDRPSSGDILVEGQSLVRRSDAELADYRLRRVGFVFQAYNLLPVLSAFENVEFIMRIQGTGSSERRERAFEVLASVGLEGLEDRRPAELSGGQQQRVAVARAIASRPMIVLADEPTANLDSANSDELLALIRRLNEEEGVTFVVASHDPKTLGYMGRNLKMEDGRIAGDI